MSVESFLISLAVARHGRLNLHAERSRSHSHKAESDKCVLPHSFQAPWKHARPDRPRSFERAEKLSTICAVQKREKETDKRVLRRARRIIEQK